MSSSDLIAEGARAPDFTLTGHDGRPYRLSTMLERHNVLLVFYPGNDTPG